MAAWLGSALAGLMLLGVLPIARWRVRREDRSLRERFGIVTWS